jgi:DNA repair protein SbcD/Mre11
MPTILHFADAHIDISSQGRHDPETGLPIRVLDFLKALDTIVDTAIREKVDLVLFAGDAYKDRTPVPTFQRLWGQRIMRLSQAGIPTLLLVGNHDLSPAIGRANALQEFDTLQVPHIHVLSKPVFLKPVDLEDLPLQVMALPWVSRSNLMAALPSSAAQPEKVFEGIETRLGELVQLWLAESDPTLPIILTAHASVQGAVYGGERSVMLGNDVVLPPALVKDPRLDYVALGHIHKAQDLNLGQQPPVVYPGSIERVDFGEVADEKFFVIAHVERGKTTVEWRKLVGRPFIDRSLTLENSEDVLAQIKVVLPTQEKMTDAIVRLVLEYPHEWENLFDESELRRYAEPAFEFHLVRRPHREARMRLPGDQTISSLNALELLDLYWRTVKTRPEDLQEVEELKKLAAETISAARQIPEK